MNQALDFPENLAFEAMSRDVFEQWQSVGDLWKASHGYVEDFSSRVSASPRPLTTIVTTNTTTMSVRALIYISDKD